MYIKNSKDFKAGLLFIFFGMSVTFLAQSYSIGTAAKMGPGYFPLLLGLMLTILGIVVCLKSLSKRKGGERKIPVRIRPVTFVLSSIVLFGLLLYPLGMILSTLFLVTISSIASDEFNIKVAILNAFVLILVILIIFVYFLQFQIPVLPAFLRGRI
jgi:uncharacterized membrane protein YfcA